MGRNGIRIYRLKWVAVFNEFIVTAHADSGLLSLSMYRTQLTHTSFLIVDEKRKRTRLTTLSYFIRPVPH